MTFLTTLRGLSLQNLNPAGPFLPKIYIKKYMFYQKGCPWSRFNTGETASFLQENMNIDKCLGYL